jgi:hypothetical protein
VQVLPNVGYLGNIIHEAGVLCSTVDNIQQVETNEHKQAFRHAAQVLVCNNACLLSRG